MDFCEAKRRVRNGELSDRGEGLIQCDNDRISARIPHPPRRGTFPPGEGIKSQERRKFMDFTTVPIGFGLALSANTAAMNHYAHLSESQKQDILNKAHNVRS